MTTTIEYLISKLETISNLTNVYTALPVPENRSDLLTYFDANVQGWEITNARGTEALDTQNAGEWDDVIRIDGWYIYQGPTTKAQMETFVEAIKALFISDRRLGNTVQKRGPMTLVFNQTDWFYEILTHHCRFEVGITSVLT